MLSYENIQHSVLLYFRLLIILVFDGHVWNMKLLDPDVFTSFSLAALTELPAALLLALFLDRWGRRWMGFASMFICGIFSFIALATPPGKLSETKSKSGAESLRPWVFGHETFIRSIYYFSRPYDRRHGDSRPIRCQYRCEYRLPIRCRNVANRRSSTGCFPHSHNWILRSYNWTLCYLLGESVI